LDVESIRTWIGPRRVKKGRHARRARRAPGVERLEDRLVLSAVQALPVLNASVTPAGGTTQMAAAAGHSSITGTVYQDTNGDGYKDGTDAGIAGRTVQLLDSVGNVLRTTTTGTNGTYLFSALGAGTFSVRQVLPTGWVQTSADPPPVTLSGLGGTSYESFGTTLPATITVDTAWLQQQGPGPYVLDHAYGTYVLATDVDVPGTAFAAAAPHVTLDLNGHTVTYGDTAAPVVANGGFEQGSGTSVPGWDLSGAPTASLASSTGLYLYGSQVLQLSNFSTTQTILSDPITIPQAGHLYTATITPAHTNSWLTTVTLSVVDAVTGQVLATGSSANPYRGFSAVTTFYATTSDPVRLRVDVTPPAGQTDSVDLDYAQLTPSFDYGVLASHQWWGNVPGYANLPPGVQSAYRNVSDFTVRNGSIVQGKANGYGSDPLFVQQTSGVTVDGVHTQDAGMDTSSVQADYASGNILIQNSTFVEHVDNISNRMLAFATVELNHTNGTITVQNNTLLGCPQSGISLTYNNPQYTALVANNTIRQNAVVTNGYGIGLAAAQNFTIADNTITPVSGRGIAVDGWSPTPILNGQIYGNYVSVQEHANREYATVESRALRLRNDVNAQGVQSNLDIHDNTFIAYAGPGMATAAYGARIDYVNPNGEMNDANVRLHNNTFKAIVTTTDPTYHADALLVDGMAPGINLSIDNNVFESNDVALGLGGADMGPVSGITFRSDTLSKSADGPARPFTGVLAGYWYYTVQDVNLVGTQTANGATANVVFQGTGAKTVTVTSLLNVTATDSSGSPVAGATVTVTNAAGTQVFQGTTDSAGHLNAIPLVSAVYSQAGTSPAGMTSTSQGPFVLVAQSGTQQLRTTGTPAGVASVRGTFAATTGGQGDSKPAAGPGPTTGGTANAPGSAGPSGTAGTSANNPAGTAAPGQAVAGAAGATAAPSSSSRTAPPGTQPVSTTIRPSGDATMQMVLTAAAKSYYGYYLEWLKYYLAPAWQELLAADAVVGKPA
jgi:hypothetical protein